MQLSHFHSIILWWTVTFQFVDVITNLLHFFKLFFRSTGSIMEYYVYQQNFVFIINKVAKFSVECFFTTILDSIHRDKFKR